MFVALSKHVFATYTTLAMGGPANSCPTCYYRVVVKFHDNKEPRHATANSGTLAQVLVGKGRVMGLLPFIFKSHQRFRRSANRLLYSQR